jgi:hypothetical protein
MAACYRIRIPNADPDPEGKKWLKGRGKKTQPKGR